MKIKIILILFLLISMLIVDCQFSSPPTQAWFIKWNFLNVKDSLPCFVGLHYRMFHDSIPAPVLPDDTIDSKGFTNAGFGWGWSTDEQIINENPILRFLILQSNDTVFDTSMSWQTANFVKEHTVENGNDVYRRISRNTFYITTN